MVIKMLFYLMDYLFFIYLVNGSEYLSIILELVSFSGLGVIVWCFYYYGVGFFFDYYLFFDNCYFIGVVWSWS